MKKGFPKYTGPFVDLTGDVFELNGKVAGSIPPSGEPNAIPFRILGEYEGQKPRWLDMLVDDKECRINPDICQPPWFRLFDCVAMAAKRRHLFGRIEEGKVDTIWLPPQPHPHAQLFAFVFAFHGRVLMIDYLERMKQFQVKK